MQYIFYALLTIAMLRFAYFFYKTKNGRVRVGLILFFIGFAISISLRPILAMCKVPVYLIDVHSPIPAFVGTAILFFIIEYYKE
jgi:hypothetical protein